ncbi:glycosyltransferase family 4 protein [Paraburkholderia sp. EB58]|uniref:glycosyltransferase family 4 protein n=1 Tax=Paraburkholderia sp. EB58 TaxID=3035125 RepID=UPI003D1C37B0
MHKPSQTIDSLQIGMNWFDERPGGLDRVVSQLVRSLPAQGVIVRGLVAGSEQVRSLSHGAVTPFALPDAPMLTRITNLRRAAAQLRNARMPDVVAAHFALYAAPVFGTFRRVPKVIHFHGPWGDESAHAARGGMNITIRRAIEKYAYRRGNLHIVLSQAFADVLQRYGVSAGTIRIVPGCVDVGHFDTGIDRRAARAALGLPQDRAMLFCVRRLVSRMGLEDLIDAVFLVRQSVPDVLLTIAGKGPLTAALQARIEHRGLSQYVHLAGFVADEALPLWYRAADMSVVPTTALEGFGLTTIESLAAGTPVLVTPVGGLPEAVAPLSQALVLEACGFRALGSGLTDALLGKRILPDETACCEYVRSHFDLPVIAAQVATVYREAIDTY